MNNQKKSKGKSALGGFLGRRQFRYGGYATVLTAIVVAVIILLNVAIGMIETNWSLSIDVTAINVTDLSEETDRVLSEVNEEINVYTLYGSTNNSSLRIQVEAVLNEYHARNNNIVVGNIDPVQEPARVNAYQKEDNELAEGDIIVSNADGSRVKIISKSSYYGMETDPYFGVTYTYFNLEAMMSGALVYATSEETPRVFFLAGHDELDSVNYCSMLTAQLENQNYDVSVLDLVSTEIVLQPGDTVVILNPQRDLSEEEYTTLSTWLTTGGRMLFAMDYATDMSVLNNFNKLLDYYQMSFGDGVIMEDASSSANWNSNYYVLVPNMDAEHDITKPLTTAGVYMMLPQSRPIKPVTMPESGLQFSNVLTTSNKAVVMENEEAGLPGTQTIAMTMLKADESDSAKDVRVALVGSLFPFGNSDYLMSRSQNIYFTMNLFNWLVNRDTSVDIGAKMMTSTALAIPDSATGWTLIAIVVAVLPLIALVCGVVVSRRRRSL